MYSTDVINETVDRSIDKAKSCERRFASQNTNRITKFDENWI